MSGEATREFASEIDAEWLQVMGGLKRAVTYIAVEGLARVTEKSPVDKGTFQNNWLVSVGQPDEATTPSRGGFTGKSAGAISAYAASVGFPVIFIQNNLPYANRIENGWSKQAPSGVVAMTVAELEVIWSGMDV